jgi:hypothetical protein
LLHAQKTRIDPPTQNKPPPPQVRPLCEPLVAASVELYRCVVRDMLPTPSKSHYLFNTRDLAKLVLGVMQVWVLAALLLHLHHHHLFLPLLNNKI